MVSAPAGERPASRWYEYLPDIAAAALAEYLARQERGTEKIRDMIVDDIRASQARNDKEHVLALLHVFHHFLRAHPEAWHPLDGGERSM